MNSSNQKFGSNDTARRAWTTPAVKRIKASDAEAGANPVIPEGPIALGS